MSDAAPSWLVAWQARQAETPPPPAPARRKKERRIEAPPPRTVTGIVEPQRWPNDGGKRREAVLDVDHNPPRVVRTVGWRTCMCCGTPFWSEDVMRLRLCDSHRGYF